MGFDAEWARAAGEIYDAMGVPAVVTRPAPDDTPIQTTLIWVEQSTPDVPGGAAPRRDPRRVAALRAVDVPTLPRGTRVSAPELQSGPARSWKVDGTDAVTADELRVVLLPVTD